MSDPVAIGEGAVGASRGRGARKRRQFSSVLRDLVREPGESISVAELAEKFGDRAFGALMLVFAVPNLIPAPPPFNASAILGVPLIIITMQLVMGRRVLWLPRFVAVRSIRRSLLRTIVEKALPTIRRAERLLTPRLSWFVGPIGVRVIGLVSLILSVVLFMPVPLGNMLPALSIAIFALALLQADGVAAIVGYVLALISLIVVAIVAGGIWLATKAVLHFIGNQLGMVVAPRGAD